MADNQISKSYEQVYDQLYATLNYDPQGINKENKVIIQLEQYKSINPEDYKNLLDPSNMEGDIGNTEKFSSLVDTIPNGQGGNFSKFYKSWIGGANIKSPEKDEKLEKQYNDAKKVLFNENGSYTIGYKKCLHKRAEYQNVLSEYYAVLSNSTRKISYQGELKKAKAEVDEAYRSLSVAENSKYTAAENTMEVSINTGGINFLADLKKDIKNSELQSLSTFLPSYPLPSNWLDSDDSAYFDFQFNTSLYKHSEHYEKKEFKAGISISWGLFGLSGNGGYTKEVKSVDDEQSEVKISGKLCKLQIIRPWFDPYVFNIKGIENDAYPSGSISDGTGFGNKFACPIYTTSLIIAKNFSIESKFEKNNIIDENMKIAGGGGIRFGPFIFGPSGGQDTSDHTVEKTGNGYKITNKGFQILGYVNSIVPPSPQA